MLGLSNRSPRTLRSQVQLWHSLWLSAIVIGFGGVLLWLHRHAKLQEIDSELAAAVEVLKSRWSELPSAPAQPLTWEVPATFRPRQVHQEDELPYFVIWDAAQQPVVASNSGRERSIAWPPAETRYEGRRDSAIKFLSRGETREAISTLSAPSSWLGESTTTQWTVLVGRDVRRDQQDLQSFSGWVVLCSLIAIAVGWLGDAWLAKRVATPLEQMAATAAKLSDQDLSQRIQTDGKILEIALLGTALNDALQRIGEAFEQQKQFTADASHELRTPLATLQLHQQLALASERSPQQYRDTLQLCQRTTAQMSRLVQSLLQLARIDLGTPPVQQSVRLDELIKQTVSSLQTVAGQRRIELTTALQPVAVQGDPVQLEQLLTNLVMNAIQYSDEGTQVQISLDAGAADLSGDQTVSRPRLIVADQGCGIDTQHLPHLFKRFYRVDPARAKETGGFGLGLSICERIALAHGASIQVESRRGAGSVFTVQFPATPSQAVGD